MTLEQRARMAVLYDLYGGLLTEKQQTAIDLYYQCDLSLGEIAAEQHTSRTAVYDLLRRTEQLLENYEAKLHLAERQTERQTILRRLAALCADRPDALTLLRALGWEEPDASPEEGRETDGL